MTASNEPRPEVEPWQPSPDVLKTMLYELAAARQAYAQLYAEFRRGTLDAPMTDDDRQKLTRLGVGMWDRNHPTLALVLKNRQSLVSHGWGPKPTVSTTEVSKIIAHILIKFSETGEIGEGYLELDDYFRSRGIGVVR